MKLRDRFIDAVFAYHNPSVLSIAPLTEPAKRVQTVFGRSYRGSVFLCCCSVLSVLIRSSQATNVIILSTIYEKQHCADKPAVKTNLLVVGFQILDVNLLVPLVPSVLFRQSIFQLNLKIPNKNFVCF